MPLTQVKMIYAIQNYNTTISFAGLDDNTLYSFYYYATTEDPSLTAETTSVQVMEAQTLQALLVNINWGVHTQAAGLLVLALLFVAF